MERKFHFTKPPFWEILTYLIWFVIVFYFGVSLLFKGSIIAWLLYVIGYYCLFIAIQNFRWHYQEKLAWKGKHKKCFNYSVNLLIISILVLIAFAIDSIRDVFW